MAKIANLCANVQAPVNLAASSSASRALLLGGRERSNARVRSRLRHRPRLAKASHFTFPFAPRVPQMKKAKVRYPGTTKTRPVRPADDRGPVRGRERQRTAEEVMAALGPTLYALGVGSRSQ